jgi:hypothetical protein
MVFDRTNFLTIVLNKIEICSEQNVNLFGTFLTLIPPNGMSGMSAMGADSWEPYAGLRHAEKLHEYLRVHKMRLLIPVEHK